MRQTLSARDGTPSSRWRYPPGNAQLDYYRRTAQEYDTAHVSAEDEHYESLQYIRGFITQLGARSVLDTGCGTGRGIRYLRQHMPELDVRGNDPSANLLKIATETHGVPSELSNCTDTLSLPSSLSFDVVMSLGVLHHVTEPSQFVRRMIGLAKKAVFISDSNYMGQGSLPGCIGKLLLTKAGVWPMLKYFQQGMKGWSYSEGDGVFYSYSVFNDLPLLREAFDKVVVIPLGHGAAEASSLPILRAHTVLVAAMR